MSDIGEREKNKRFGRQWSCLRADEFSHAIRLKCATRIAAYMSCINDKTKFTCWVVCEFRGTRTCHHKNCIHFTQSTCSYFLRFSSVPPSSASFPFLFYVFIFSLSFHSHFGIPVVVATNVRVMSS